MINPVKALVGLLVVAVALAAAFSIAGVKALLGIGQ